MYIEQDGKAHRKIKNINDDIEYLQNFFLQNEHFPLFSQVLLETRTDCNLSCRFCPQYHHKRRNQVMDWSVYTKIIDELHSIGFGGRIAFFMTNEPLLEERLINMIQYARQKSQRFFLDITTNGVLLNVAIVDTLFGAGLDNININDYRGDRVKHPNKLSKNLIEIYNTFKHNPKISFYYRSNKEILSNYAGIINQEDDKIYGFCNFPFRKLSISSDGNVILCCNDYLYTTNFGSVTERSLSEIWQDKALNQYRLSLLSNKRINLCDGCNQVTQYSAF